MPRRDLQALLPLLMSKMRSSSIALLIGGASTVLLAALAASTLWQQRAWRIEQAAVAQASLAAKAADAANGLAASWDTLIGEVCDEALELPARVRLLERALPDAEWRIFEQRARVFPPSDVAEPPTDQEREYFARVEAVLRRGAEMPAEEAAEWARTVWIAVAHPGLRSEAALVRARAMARAGDLAGAEAMRTAAMHGPLSFTAALSAPAAFLAAYEQWRASGQREAARAALEEVLQRAAYGDMDARYVRALQAELAPEDTALASVAEVAAQRCARAQRLTRFAFESDRFAMQRDEDWILVHWAPRGAWRIAAALPRQQLASLLPLAALADATEHAVELRFAAAAAADVVASTSTDVRADAPRAFTALPEPFAALRLGIAWTPLEEQTSAWIELALLLSVGAAAAIGLFAALRLARREALLAARQTEFTGNLAHELRTPLAALLLHAELLDGPAVEDPERRTTHLDVMRKEALRLTRLVDRVVALAAGRPAPATVSAALGDVLERVLDRASVEVALRSEVPLAWRVRDGEGMLSALSELIDNAERHGAAPIEVEVAAVPEANAAAPQVEVRVLDRGAGISAEDRERIFERFERGSKARRDAVRGAGLGLALVKNFAEAAGGSIRCTPRADGGTCFALRLPLENPSLPFTRESQA